MNTTQRVLDAAEAVSSFICVDWEAIPPRYSYEDSDEAREALQALDKARVEFEREREKGAVDDTPG